MIFTTSQKKRIQKTILKRSEKEIKQVNKAKYIRVILDNNLIWKCHNESLNESLSRGIGIQYKI